MPIALLSLIAGCKLCRYIALALAVLAAGWAYIAHVKAEARREVVAAYEAATAKESQRRMAVLEQAQAQARAAADKLAQTEKRNAGLLSKINRLSARHDRDACLDADSVRRLREIGRAPGDGAGKPAR